MRSYYINDLVGFKKELEKRKKKLKLKLWKDVAEYCGMLPNSLYQLTLGKRNPTLPTLEKLLVLEPKETREAFYSKLLSYTDGGLPYSRKFNKKRYIRTYHVKKVDEENQQHHTKDLGEFGVRQLVAAVCLQACSDYRQARENLDKKSNDIYQNGTDKQTIDECRVFFMSPMFRYSSKQTNLKKIEKCIMKSDLPELTVKHRNSHRTEKPHYN